MSDTSLYQALQAVMAQNVTDMKLSDCILGTVESASPFAIRIDPRTIVKAEYLILTDLVRDFSVDITVSHTTTRGGKRLLSTTVWPSVKWS